MSPTGALLPFASSWFILTSEDISRSLLIFVSSVSAAVTQEHLKDRALFSLPPPPPGANPTEYYHLMASQRSPYGDLLMQSGAAAAAAAAAAAHLPDYISPVDGEHFFLISIQYQMIDLNPLNSFINPFSSQHVSHS